VDVAALRLLLMAFAGGWNDQRQEALAYLREVPHRRFKWAAVLGHHAIISLPGTEA
jgi:hypothetical protein